MSKVLDLWAGMTGTVLPFAGSTAPTGWLLCFGQSLLRADYPALFAAIGTTYGAADATHFNVPDMRGRISAGKDDMGGAAANRLTTASGGVNGVALGAVGGSQAHVLTEAQMPGHTHAGSTDAQGAHTHTVNAVGAGVMSMNAITDASQNVSNVPAAQGTSSAGSHAHNVTVGNAGGGGAHPNVQPTVVLNSIIKT